jgi:hypothetical protein
LWTYHQMGLCRLEGAPFDAVKNILKHFQHPPPIVPQDQPVQHANLLDTPPPPLNQLEEKFIQEVVGVFLYLTQAVDLTMLTPLSALASKQAAHTHTQNNAKMLSIFRLCNISRRRNCHLPGKQYEACNTQQCIISI